jgi:hypothetical protein
VCVHVKPSPWKIAKNETIKRAGEQAKKEMKTSSFVGDEEKRKTGKQAAPRLTQRYSSKNEEQSVMVGVSNALMWADHTIA